VKREHRNASLNLLYALVGMLENRHWRDIMKERKLALLLAMEDYEEGGTAELCSSPRK